MRARDRPLPDAHPARLILTLSLTATVGLGIGRFAYALVLPSYGGQVALPTLQFAAQFPLNELYPWSSQ